MRLIPFVLFAAFLSQAGPALHAGDAAKDDAQGLQGVWEIVEATLDGKSIPEDVRANIKFAFKGDKMRLSGPGGIGEREYTFKIDPTQKPKAIDITPLDGAFKGKTASAIYELKGDELKFCMSNETTKDRPKDFQSATGSKLGLFVLKRSK